MRLRLLATSLVAAVVGAVVWSTAAPAQAHASLISSDPEDGSVVSSLPDEITLTFNEPVRLESDGVTAFDAAGDEWDVEAASRDNVVAVTPVGDPGAGTVVISWTVTSEDGHAISGAVTFAIGAASAGGAALTATEPPTTTSVARYLAAAVAGTGLLLAIGLGVRGAPGADTAWTVGLVGAVLLGPLHSLATEGRGLGDLTDWVAWLDGLTGRSSLMLLAAYVVTAAVARARRGVLLGAAAPVLALVVAATVTWPRPEAPEVAAAVEATPEPVVATGRLGDAGTVELTVTPGAGREAGVDLRLLTPEGTPLEPFAPPTLTLDHDQVSLGTQDLAASGGPGAYGTNLTIPLDGEWTAQVSVRLDEFDNPVVVIPFEL